MVGSERNLEGKRGLGFLRGLGREPGGKGCLEDDDKWIGLFLPLLLRPFFLQLGKSEKKERI